MLSRSSSIIVNSLYIIISLLFIESRHFGKCKDFWSKSEFFAPSEKNPADNPWAVSLSTIIGVCKVVIIVSYHIRHYDIDS